MAKAPLLPTKFMTSRQIEKCCRKLYGLEYHEALEGAYDNLREYTIDIEKQLHSRRESEGTGSV